MAVPSPVVRSLYRSLLREAQRLDERPLLKTLMPLPKRIQNAVHRVSQLYTPGSVVYAELVREAFRRDAGLPLAVGFDALTAMKNHCAAVEAQLPKIQRDHAPLTAALEAAAADPVRFSAQSIAIPTEMPPRVEGKGAAGGCALAALDMAASSSSRCALLRSAGFELRPGLGLIAHPLSSAHTDRRVMLLTEVGQQSVTGLVLDMMYSYPLSHGNPMFPEVLWGHEVYNGGYCHVDFTMPPTANVAVLHTLAPPKPKTHPAWLSWAMREDPTVTPQAEEHHELHCVPLIRGADGQPTLYYSRVEALPYLATLAPGEPRSALRVYWGCMKWSTTQLLNEVALGHWMPVELSPSFFAAYHVGANGEADAGEPPGEADVAPPVETFPTHEALAKSRAQREKLHGADMTPPQKYPPDQPLCRREALWDQVLYSLGGEYRALVGSMNPFAGRDSGRAPPADVLPDKVQDLLADLEGGEPEGDDDSE